MNVGKLGEGVYLLTVGPSGRTVKRAKMVKATKKIPEETQNVATEPKYEPEVKYIPAKEIAKALGIHINKVYGNHALLAKYIIRPDGRHYLYNPTLLEDVAVVQFLKHGLTLKKAEAKREEAPKVEEPSVLEATAEVQPAVEMERPASPPVTVNRRVYCHEFERVFESVTDAARAIGVRREILSKALRAGHKCHGYTFEYVGDDGLPMWNTAKAIARKLHISDTTVLHYAKEMPDGMVIHKKNEAPLFHRDVLALPIWDRVRENKKKNRPKPVVIIELGETIGSLTAAAKRVGGSAAGIANAIKDHMPYMGYHFAYA